MKNEKKLKYFGLFPLLILPIIFSSLISGCGTSEVEKKDMVNRFMLQANKFKTATLSLVSEGKIFA